MGPVVLSLTDDSLLHCRGAHPLPGQHHQQSPRQGPPVRGPVLLQQRDGGHQ